jgi:hypothetical protein
VTIQIISISSAPARRRLVVRVAPAPDPAWQREAAARAPVAKPFDLRLRRVLREAAGLSRGSRAASRHGCRKSTRIDTMSFHFVFRK